MPKLRKINYNLTIDVLSEELARELLRCIKEESTVIVITQSEVTRYQSRKDGFFESLLDQAAGSILGSVAFKDKVSTVKQKLNYKPNINAFSYYPNIFFGQTPTPYYKGSRSNIMLYGAGVKNAVNLEYGRKSGVNHTSLEYRIQRVVESDLINQTVSYGGISIKGDHLAAFDGRLQWIGISGLVGVSSLRFDHEIKLGLIHRNTHDNQSFLGYTMGYNGQFHAFGFMGLYYDFDHFGGINFDRNAQQWMFSNINVGFQTAIHPFTARLGYDWILGKEAQLMHQGLVAELSFSFFNQ